jgi:hypothetical protein
MAAAYFHRQTVVTSAMSSVSNEIIKHEFFTKVTVVAAASICTLIIEIDSRVPLISLNNFVLEWIGRKG